MSFTLIYISMKKENNKYPSFLYNEQDEDLNTRPAYTNRQPAKKTAKQINGGLKGIGTTDELLYLSGNAYTTRQLNRKS